jgi:hypothetical protein
MPQYIRAYLHMHIGLHAYINTYIHIFIHTYVRTYAYTYNIYYIHIRRGNKSFKSNLSLTQYWRWRYWKLPTWLLHWQNSLTYKSYLWSGFVFRLWKYATFMEEWVFMMATNVRTRESWRIGSKIYSRMDESMLLLTSRMVKLRSILIDVSVTTEKPELIKLHQK